MAAATTFYVIAYDITSDKRRRKVYNALSGYCSWSQYSLFEGHLSDKERVALEEKLRKLMDEDEDSVRLYPLCAGDLAKVITLGSEPPKDEGPLIV